MTLQKIPSVAGSLSVDSDDSKKIRSSIHSIPIAAAFGVIAVLVSLYGLVYAIDSILPTPLSLADEKFQPDAFIMERARRDLKILTDIGPRVTGSRENEILAADFLKREINIIVQKSHKNQKLELDVQVVSGSLYLQTKLHGNIFSYSNLQNIVVKVHANNNATQSVLINSHFDSVPTSPGGSDDGINCATMLEVLRKLSREPKRPLNNLIFLFNGAEETGMKAAHGFITKHKWAKDCKVLLNLDAAGAGGKIILFQSGPEAPWLLTYYSRVPHPYGQAAGEEIFQSNIIPSYTDFRIFRDYGGLVGLDMAFLKQGYRYHTKYDDLEHIPLGSFQHVGDNTLSLVRSLANAPEVSNPKYNPGKIIFYDFLGLFMVSYTQTVGHVVNYVVVVLSLGIFAFSVHTFKLGYSKETLTYFVLTFGAITGGWIAAAVFTVLISLLTDKSGYSMSWYGNPWLILGLYVAPTIAFSSAFLPFIRHEKLTHNIEAQIQAHCVRFIWTLILFFGSITNIRSMYALLILVLFNTIGFILIHIFKFQHTVRKWQVLYFVSLIIPTIFLMYTALMTYCLFIPVTGRIGSNKNADLLIGLLSTALTLVIISPYVALTTLVRHFKYLLAFLALVFAISFIIIFTPLGFPYSGNTNSPAPQRYWILHTRRVIHDENGAETKRDSGYFLLNLDRNSPHKVKSQVKEIARVKSLDADCKKYLLCGLPLVGWKMIPAIKDSSSWIPAGQPMLDQSVKLDVLSKVQVSPTVLRYNVSIIGPDRVGVYLSPKKGHKVLAISLIDKMPSDSKIAVWNNRYLYYMDHICGKEIAPLKFSFDLEVPANSSGATTEIAVSGIYVHDNLNRKVPHYVRFLNEFPDWADLTAWLGCYESFWI